MTSNFLLRQFFDCESSTYTYLLADTKSLEAVIIDPVRENFQRHLSFINEMKFKLKYILETHVHADHITGASALREATGAKTGICHLAKVDCADLALKDGDQLQFGSFVIRV